MLSQKTKYAIRTILFLAAECKPNERKSLKELSETLKIPAPFLGKILQELVPKNIISSTKGPNGGFYLTDENRKIRLLKVVEMIDGLSFFDSCGLGLSSCSDSKPCPIHNDFKEARNIIYSIFSEKTIEEIATDIEKYEYILVR